MKGTGNSPQRMRKVWSDNMNCPIAQNKPVESYAQKKCPNSGVIATPPFVFEKTLLKMCSQLKSKQQKEKAKN